jgi:hypothetical protein
LRVARRRIKPYCLSLVVRLRHNVQLTAAH